MIERLFSKEAEGSREWPFLVGGGEEEWDGNQKCLDKEMQVVVRCRT